MIRNSFRFALYGGFLASLLAGCGDSGAGTATLADAGGVVNYKGGPLAGASVTFIPEEGPIATGTTDLQGKFKLFTGSVPGVAVGNCKVTITAFQGGNPSNAGSQPDPTKMGKPSSPEEAQKRIQGMDPTKAMLDADKVKEAKDGAKSIINMRYGSGDSSGLTATVSKDSSKNQFTFTVEE